MFTISVVKEALKDTPFFSPETVAFFGTKTPVNEVWQSARGGLIFITRETNAPEGCGEWFVRLLLLAVPEWGIPVQVETLSEWETEEGARADVKMILRGGKI